MIRAQSLIASIVVITLAFASGCYNPRSFQSDSADIVVATSIWSSPQYRIVFEPLPLAEGSAERTYSFRSPPPIDMGFGLNFTEVADYEALAAVGATASAEIRDSLRDVLWAREGRIAAHDPEAGWWLVGQSPIRPPVGWCEHTKGQVQHAQWEQDENAWTLLHGGVILGAQQPQIFWLPRREECTLTVRITAEVEVQLTGQILPTLTGGFPGTL